MSLGVLSEYICKKLYFNYINEDPKILYFNKNQTDNINYQNITWITNNNGIYPLVCKVDQMIKHRKNLNLVQIGLDFDQCLDWISKQTYNSFIIEPVYSIKKELYLMMEFNAEYDTIYFSNNGGTSFEFNHNIQQTNVNPITKFIDYVELGITDIQLQHTITTLYNFYCKYCFTFMEINPLIQTSNTYFPLDFATKYDTTSLYKWPSEDLNIFNTYSYYCSPKHNIELKIKELDDTTGGSLKFTLLNPNGSIWTLVAGGGASVLYTDAIYNLGLFNELGNYGEYSGDPPTNHVYKYTSLIFEQILKSETDKQIKIIVGGGISNFTDVEQTFEGVIQAIVEKADLLLKKNVVFYVRRGGLNYEKGLQKFKSITTTLSIPCQVYGPETHITKFLSSILDSDINKKLKSTENTDLHSHINLNLPKVYNNIINKVTSNVPQLFYGPNSKIVIINYMVNVVQRILDYDYLCGKKFEDISIVGIIHPPKKNTYFSVFWGNKEVFLPVFDSLSSALNYNSSIDVVINYHSFRSAFKSSMEALTFDSIKVVTIVAEGIAEQDARILQLTSKNLGKTIIGPATVGSIMVGNLRVGNTCGSMQNIKDLRLYKKGSVSIVTRSGGLLNEMCNIVSQVTDGIKEAVSIGGDRYPGSTFLDHIKRFEQDDDVKLICMLGEIGNTLELEVAEAVRMGIIKKPIIAWITGICIDESTDNIQFGHAGSVANNWYELATFKNKYMKSGGIYVPDSFEQMQDLIGDVALTRGFQKQNLPDSDCLISDPTKLVRKHADFYSSISNETKPILEYNGVPITEIINKDYSIGHTIGHLLFKKNIPLYFAKFLEMVISICADHGIAVSSAHNTAVCARAGQNLSAAVASGLLCIHEKHGGAMQEAASTFYKSKYVYGLSPEEFVNKMKDENRYIPGIGHLYNNSTNKRDKRIDLLLNYIFNNFPNYDLVSYAQDVEKITLRKKENLILNVDGLVATAIVSVFYYEYGSNSIEDLLELQSLNSIFVIARTIGLCATYADQHRLKQPLYRHPIDSITYVP